ncbi:MarR family transcriptional regulator [Synechocystis sp. PCC 7509]|uniref:MarR family transcriptional regulator n=1 Tax=Synechocystis sp. PCC 7509 TaxID=927677 RepID=UPI0011DE2567|nr:helix-turn-helix domain-containing protein [Synechocystis sp. PCC 7509]
MTYLDSNEIIAILDKSGLNRKKQMRVLFALITKTTVASRDIEQILGIHRSTALNYAKNLTDLGLITKRIKLGTEDNSKPTYLYSLAPRTTKEAITEVAKSLGILDEITSTSNYTQPFQQTEAFRPSLEAPLQQQSSREDSHQTLQSDKPTLESTVMHEIVEPEISSVTSDTQLPRTSEEVHSSVENVTAQPTAANKSNSSTLAELLISKIPEFNPSWSEDLQLRWLAAFEQLIKLGAEKSSSYINLKR